MFGEGSNLFQLRGGTLICESHLSGKNFFFFFFLPAAPDGPGKAVWDFVSEVVWKDLCHADDLSVILQEHKSILVQALSVLQALYRCQDQWHSKSDTSKFDFSSAVHSRVRCADCSIKGTKLALFLY